MPYCRWGAHEPSFDSPLMGEGEADNVASGGDRDILRPVDRITHRRSMDGLAGVELPEGTAGSRCNCFKSSGIIREEQRSPAVVSVPPQEFPRPTWG